jgi:hypothetical protein
MRSVAGIAALEFEVGLERVANHSDDGCRYGQDEFLVAAW